MTGFLAHLVRMALGETGEGAIRLDLPPRFAPTPPDNGRHDEDWTLPPPTSPVADAEQRYDPRDLAEELYTPLSRSPAEPRRISRSPTAAADPQTAPAELPGRQPAARTPVDAERSAPDRADRRATRPLASSAHSEPQRSGPIRIAEQPAAAPKIEPLRIPAIPRGRETPSAPLSDGLLAGRTLPARALDPVIHVTIDRIDVRAPAAPATPAPRRRPMEPSVTLSDFLQDKRAQR